jgi:hypothetical protein
MRRTKWVWLTALCTAFTVGAALNACGSDSDDSSSGGGSGGTGASGGSGGSGGTAGGGGTSGSGATGGSAGSGGQADASAVEVLDPKQDHYGKTFSEWGAEWWKWVYENPGPNHPLADTTGQYCDTNQPSNMFFLAGTSGGSVTRNCTLPATKPVFFPLINMAADNGGVAPDASSTEQELQDFINGAIASVNLLELQIDGTSVGSSVSDFSDYLTATQKFSYTVPDTTDNYYRKVLSTDFSGLVDPSFSKGYFVMLAPLSKGAHTIHFKAAAGDQDAGGFSLEVTYNLTVQ